MWSQEALLCRVRRPSVDPGGSLWIQEALCGSRRRYMEPGDCRARRPSYVEPGGPIGYRRPFSVERRAKRPSVEPGGDSIEPGGSLWSREARCGVRRPFSVEPGGPLWIQEALYESKRPYVDPGGPPL